VIFAPARQRLHALERAAGRLGAGELNARAPAAGRDEIARVAAAFNRMADDLASRTDALLRSNELRRQMLTDISHEPRTPLTTIRGYLDTLDIPSIAADDEKRHRYLDTVRGETGRLERLVLDLLDLARFEDSVTSLAPRVFAIERLFDAVARRFEHDAALAGVTIASTVASDADQLSADPDRLDQALSNLIANALRHTAPGRDDCTGRPHQQRQQRHQRHHLLHRGHRFGERHRGGTPAAPVRSLLQGGRRAGGRGGRQRARTLDRQGHRRTPWRYDHGNERTGTHGVRHDVAAGGDVGAIHLTVVGAIRLTIVGAMGLRWSVRSPLRQSVPSGFAVGADASVLTPGRSTCR
jgi:hypothetical protein